MSLKEILARDNVHTFQYSMNMAGVKSLEFCALFLLVVGVSVYPFTHFDPPAWMIMPIVVGIGAIAVFLVAQFWRSFAKSAFVAYDDEFLFVGDRHENAVCIPWNVVDVHNTGLAEPGKGADLKMNFDGEKVRLILFSPIVCIPQFETVLHTILEHIKDNQPAKKS